MQAPLSTATLRYPGRINNLAQLHQLVSMGNHVPMWVHKSKAGQLWAQHGANNAVVAHPGIPIPLPSPDQTQTPPPTLDPTQQQPQRFAMGGSVQPPKNLMQSPIGTPVQTAA